MAQTTSSRPGQRRLLGGVLVLLAIIAIGVAAALALGFGDGGPDCGSDPQTIGAGDVPGGGRWSVEASVEPNGGCEHRLLNVAFRPFGTTAGSWSAGRDFLEDDTFGEPLAIEALNEPTAFSGIVGPRVQAIRVTFASHASTVVHARSAPKRLRRQLPWLRAFRFFVTFSRPRDLVREVALVDARHRVILTVRPSSEGFFKASDARAVTG